MRTPSPTIRATLTGAALALVVPAAVAQSAAGPQGEVNRNPLDQHTHTAAHTTHFGGSQGSGSGSGRSGTTILVYDNNTNHKFALQAALGLCPTTTSAANASNFDTLLSSQAWDVVLVDCPSTTPANGWTALINYVAAGNSVAMSFWDWDNGSGAGDPALAGAFEVNTVGSDISLDATTPLTDSGLTTIFSGVTMPNSDWHNHWLDDGDQFTPFGTGVAIADIGTPTSPVMVLGNNGRTICAPALDEAGSTWITGGDARLLWTNIILEIGKTPASWTNYGVGYPGTNGIPGLILSANPVLGSAVTMTIDNSLGATTLGILWFGFAQLSIPGSWGGDLLVSPSITLILSLPSFGLALNGTIPTDSTLDGLEIFAQCLEVDAGASDGISNTPGLMMVLGS